MSAVSFSSCRISVFSFFYNNNNIKWKCVFNILIQILLTLLGWGRKQKGRKREHGGERVCEREWTFAWEHVTMLSGVFLLLGGAFWVNRKRLLKKKPKQFGDSLGICGGKDRSCNSFLKHRNLHLLQSDFIVYILLKNISQPQVSSFWQRFICVALFFFLAVGEALPSETSSFNSFQW